VSYITHRSTCTSGSYFVARDSLSLRIRNGDGRNTATLTSDVVATTRDSVDIYASYTGKRLDLDDSCTFEYSLNGGVTWSNVVSATETNVSLLTNSLVLRLRLESDATTESCSLDALRLYER
jgi:hypothetical protein